MKKLLIGIFILLGLAGLVWLIWYFTTHPKTLKVISVDKQNRIIKTLSPLGNISFKALDGANVFDTVIRKNDKYELLYRSNDLGETIEIVFTRTKGIPPLEAATVNMSTGQVTYHPPVLMTSQTN